MASDAETANTLVLFPIAVLIVFGLGAVAIDAATLFLGQRRLADLSAAIANDAVAAIDIASFYRPDEDLRLDATRAAVRAGQLRAGQTEDRGLEDVDCALAVDIDRVTVRCSGQVRPILASFWPLSERRRVSVSETAVGVER